MGDDGLEYDRIDYELKEATPIVSTTEEEEGAQDGEDIELRHYVHHHNRTKNNLNKSMQAGVKETLIWNLLISIRNMSRTNKSLPMKWVVISNRLKSSLTMLARERPQLMCVSPNATRLGNCLMISVCPDVMT